MLSNSSQFCSNASFYEKLINSQIFPYSLIFHVFNINVATLSNNKKTQNDNFLIETSIEGKID